MGHREEFSGAKGLGVHIGRVEVFVDVSSLDLSQCDLILDIIEHHTRIGIRDICLLSTVLGTLSQNRSTVSVLGTMSLINTVSVLGTLSQFHY